MARPARFADWDIYILQLAFHWPCTGFAQHHRILILDLLFFMVYHECVNVMFLFPSSTKGVLET